MLVLRKVKLILRVLPKPCFLAGNRNSDFSESKMNSTKNNSYPIYEGLYILMENGEEKIKQNGVQYLPSPTKSQSDKKEYK